MSHPEKRGKGPRPWRVKYRRPDGSYGSESGFATKAAAKAWGDDQEALIRQGRWIDPRLSTTTLRDWVKEWQEAAPSQGRTADGRTYLLGILLPELGGHALADITFFRVRNWARAQDKLRARRTVTDCVSLLSTILTAAVDDGRLLANPIANRQLKLGPATPTGRERRRRAVTPETVYALYCRAQAAGLPPAGPLMILLGAYLGLRYGEVAGVHKDNLLVETEEGCVFRVVPDVGALHEEPGRPPFLGPPKPPNGARDVLYPDFLAILVRAWLEAWRKRHPDRDHPFAGARGAHWRRSAFARRVMRPVCDGWTSREIVGGRGHAARPARTYEPICEGLDFHSLRHTHETWLAEDRIPNVCINARVGHAPPSGIEGVYRHDTPEMRRQAVEALEKRWRRGRLQASGLVVVAG